MGSLTDLINMIPGVGQNKHLKDLQVDEKELGRVVAIINSMTPMERHKHGIINGSRRKRIAGGSGTTVQHVNQLLKNYDHVMKMMKKINKGGLKKFGRGFSPFK
jgi:signal recognition particle subunit SRP54